MKKATYILIFFFCISSTVTISQNSNDFHHQKSKIGFGAKKIVKKLAEYNALDDGCVGPPCFKTDGYKAYKKLNQKINISQAIRLTNHPNAVVRCYSFLCLARKRYTALQSIVDRHSDDTAIVNYTSGCRTNAYPVSEMMKLFLKDYERQADDEPGEKSALKTAEDYFEMHYGLYDELDENVSKRKLRHVDKKSKKYILRAIELDSSLGYLYSELGRIECYLKQYKKSLKDFNLALQKGERVYGEIAEVKSLQGAHQEAINYLDKAIQNDPTNGNIYLKRAIQRKIIGDGLGYYNDSMQSIELNMTTDALVHRGKANMDDNPLAAINDFDRAIAKNYEVSCFQYWDRAEAKNKTGDYLGAIADCDTVLKYGKEFTIAKATIAYAYTMQGKYSEALAIYDSLKTLYPEIRVMDADIGFVYYKMKDYETALRYYDAVVDANSNCFVDITVKWREDWYYIRGNIYFNKNNLAKACENWSRSPSEDAKKALSQYCN